MTAKATRANAWERWSASAKTTCARVCIRRDCGCANCWLHELSSPLIPTQAPLERGALCFLTQRACCPDIYTHRLRIMEKPNEATVIAHVGGTGAGDAT